MPSPRSLAGMLTGHRPSDPANTTRSSTVMRPESGFSRPAIERRVVVLPHPDGPSSVNSAPSATSKETSCTANTRVCSAAPALAALACLRVRLSASNVLVRLSMLSTGSPGGLVSLLPEADLCPQLVRDGHEHHECEHHDHAEGREDGELPVLELLEDEDREHLVARCVEQDRAAQLAERDDEDVDPARDEAGTEQRKQDPPERLPPARPADLRRLLQLTCDLLHRDDRVTHPVWQVPGAVGDEQ